MSIIQDCYNIYDREYARRLQRKAMKNAVEMEIAGNLAFIREAVRAGIGGAEIVAGLEDRQFIAALAAGMDLNDIRKARLSGNTFAGIDEFKKYAGWSTERLIKKVYARIATLKRLLAVDASIDFSRKLQYLFKLLLLIIAHIDNRHLIVRKSTALNNDQITFSKMENSHD